MEEEQKRMKRHYYQNQIRLSLDKIQKQLHNLDEKLDNLKNGNGNIVIQECNELRSGL